MAERKQADPEANNAGEGDGVSLPDAAIIGILSVAATASLALTDVSVADLFGLAFGGLLRSALIFLVFVPLPAAYVATISKDGFRKEALAGLLALPVALWGIQFAALGTGILLGNLLTSYKARSIFKGDNTGWTYWKSVGGAITMIALVAGLTAGYTFHTDTDWQDTIKAEITNQTTQIAVDYADLSGSGSALTQQQRQQLIDTAGVLAENASAATLLVAEDAVVLAMEEDGSFTSQQQSTITGTFTVLDRTVPDEIQRQIEQRVGEQVDELVFGRDVSAAGAVQQRIQSFVDRLVQPSPEATTGVIFLTISFLLILKIPFGLIGALYAGILASLRGRL